MTYLQTIAMTTGEATVAVTVIPAATTLVVLVVWQLFGLARRAVVAVKIDGSGCAPAVTGHAARGRRRRPVPLGGGTDVGHC